ncbi:aromatic alcohol reductase [Aspergillus foveolatus]|uniref:aromatic alcohol reductase n=1 Tax=Aspergillus foveolatus TaxID=210207 RepID=UPI003CCCADEB
MSSPLKNITLVGASGSVGQILLTALLKASDFNITVLARSSSTASFPASVTVRKSDFSLADLRGALTGQDAVISAVGATAFAEQKKLIDAAVAAGVSRFIPSEFSAESQNDTVLALLPLFGQKKEVIDYLKTKERHLSWTGIACSGLFDWGIANDFLGYDIGSRTATIWDDGNKKFTFTNQAQLGRALVSALRSPGATANRYLYIASVETSQNEILAALERATESSWMVQRTTTNAEVNDATAKLQEGDFSGALTLVRATVYGNIPGLKSNYAKDRDLANGLLGLEEESVEGTIQRVVGDANKQ